MAYHIDGPASFLAHLLCLDMGSWITFGSVIPGVGCVLARVWWESACMVQHHICSILCSQPMSHMGHSSNELQASTGLGSIARYSPSLLGLL